MGEFPRTMVGGVSLPRLIAGSNWMLGYSHTSLAKDRFIKDFQTRKRISAILEVFLAAGVDAIMAPPSQFLQEAICEAEDLSGKRMTRILTPWLNIKPGGSPDQEAEPALDQCVQLGATFCMPHQSVTDALIDLRDQVIRDMDRYARMIRDRGMIPGLSTHMPETIVIADQTDLDVETYIQIYNAAGFLMHTEADWVMKIIRNARKPVMTIKPLAAGRLLPVVGLSFVWSTIRPIDMVTVGAATPEEAREVIEISLDLLEHRVPEYDLQTTRSKRSLHP